VENRPESVTKEVERGEERGTVIADNPSESATKDAKNRVEKRLEMAEKS